MSERPTPEADALEKLYRGSRKPIPWEAINKCQELELKLAERDQWKERFEKLMESSAETLAAERALADRLDTAIEDILPHIPNMEPIGAAAHSAHNRAAWNLRLAFTAWKEARK